MFKKMKLGVKIIAGYLLMIVCVIITRLVGCPHNQPAP